MPCIVFSPIPSQPQATYPTLPSQPPLPNPCKVVEPGDDDEDQSWGEWGCKNEDYYEEQDELVGDEETTIGELLRMGRVSLPSSSSWEMETQR